MAALRSSTNQRVLKGQISNIGMLSKVCRTCDINYCNIIDEILQFIKHTLGDNTPLPVMGAPIER